MSIIKPEIMSPVIVVRMDRGIAEGERVTGCSTTGIGTLPFFYSIFFPVIRGKFELIYPITKLYLFYRVTHDKSE
ncbi:MAG: hypothetical protein E4H16_02570 [Candidatus Atribacteria bacterium]|nr:MAG: hypothetical protein E4H16_02570 [Candidatus Atribacteria bacterium]